VEGGVKRNGRKRLTWLAAGCALFVPVSGCFNGHRLLSRSPECASQAEEPCCPVYAKFHPVPTQPVFSPRTVEMPAPPAMEPIPTPSPSTATGSKAVPSGQSVTAADLDCPDWLFAPRIADALIQKSEPSVAVKADAGTKSAGQGGAARK
jgi:hypothetical protein